MREEIFRRDSRETVHVERVVEAWGVFDQEGREDDKRGDWRRRTPAEFAAAIVAAAEGLSDPYVEPREDHGSGIVCVFGDRPTTDEEKDDHDHRMHMAWLSAKGTYMRGRAKYEDQP